MFILYANKTDLSVRKREQLTSGSVNVYPVRFEFSADWDGLERVAVFRAGTESRSVALDTDGQCTIPWEVLTSKGKQLTAGVYGTLGGDVVLPTVWADLGTILEGAAPGKDAQPPTPDLWRQELERKQDKLRGTPGQAVGFDGGGRAVPVDMPSGGGTAFEFGHGLKRTGNVISVDAVDDFKGDNTLPMTAAGVQTVVGNIDVLLGTI